jgi:hypothetical protein
VLGDIEAFQLVLFADAQAEEGFYDQGEDEAEDEGVDDGGGDADELLEELRSAAGDGTEGEDADQEGAERPADAVDVPGRYSAFSLRSPVRIRMTSLMG